MKVHMHAKTKRSILSLINFISFNRQKLKMLSFTQVLKNVLLYDSKIEESNFYSFDRAKFYIMDTQ